MPMAGRVASAATTPYRTATCRTSVSERPCSKLRGGHSMARVIRCRTSRDSRASCFWASRERSAYQRMFHGTPGFRLSAFELGLAAARNPLFPGCQGVVGIRFRENGDDATCHLELELVPAFETCPPADGRRDHQWCFVFDGDGHGNGESNYSVAPQPCPREP